MSVESFDNCGTQRVLPIRIESVEDPRLDRYRQLKGSRHTRRQDHFICEGRLTVQRLIESDFEIESLLISDNCSANFRAQLLRADYSGTQTRIFSVSAVVGQSLVGFKFHRGIMACGVRRRFCHVSLDTSHRGSNTIFVCCPHTTLTDNLGSIIRNAAAFGAAGVIVGRQSVDPFSRRAIRVSMGNCFRVPIYEPMDLEAELQKLKRDDGFEIIATSLAADAIDVGHYRPGRKTVLLLGNEGTGLSESWTGLADQQIRIPMSNGVDSLNVATSAAIFLHEFNKSSPNAVDET